MRDKHTLCPNVPLQFQEGSNISTPTKGRLEVGFFGLKNALKQSEGALVCGDGPMWVVWAADHPLTVIGPDSQRPEQVVIVAITGNGPSSEVNARHIVETFNTRHAPELEEAVGLLKVWIEEADSTWKRTMTLNPFEPRPSWGKSAAEKASIDFLSRLGYIDGKEQHGTCE